MSEGFKPHRSFYIVVGHDEEGRGVDGAAYAARHLNNIGVTQLEYILDEGTAIYNGLPGFSTPIAMISVTEKGIVNFKLSANDLVVVKLLVAWNRPSEVV